MADFDDVRRLAADETGLCVVSVTRADGSVHSSVVNAGPIDHPITGAPMLGLVVRGASQKRGLVASAGRMSATFRRGWDWAGVEGAAEIIDTDVTAGPRGLAALLRDVFTAAGGTHDDWDEYDRVMVADGRVAVLISPDRVLGNG